MNNPNAGRLGLAVVALTLVGALWFAWYSSSRAPAPAPTQAKQAPATQPAPARAPVSQRISLPPPEDRTLALVPEQPEPTRSITSDVKLKLNRAVQSVVLPVKKDCLEPFVDEQGGVVEVILDVVTYDGEVVDVGYRSFPPSPDDVVQCVADKVWEKPWDKMPITGELRLQRTLQLKARPQ